MSKDMKSKFRNIISLRDLTVTFTKKKWLFIGFFLGTLIIGLAITFSKIPVFQSISTLQLGDVYFEDDLYKYYPAEAKVLEVFAPGMDVSELESLALDKITKNIRSVDILEEVLDEVNLDVNREELEKTISTLVDRKNKVVKVIITYPVAGDSYRINQALINTYLESNINDKSAIIEDLIGNIDEEINIFEKDIADLEETNKIDLEGETNSQSKEAIVIDLNRIRYNLQKNRELYISNIEITEKPDIPLESVNADYARNSIIVIFVSIAVGLIAVYIPNIFASLKD